MIALSLMMPPKMERLKTRRDEGSQSRSLGDELEPVAIEIFAADEEEEEFDEFEDDDDFDDDEEEDFDDEFEDDDDF
ncbi:MAG: hypothetical protein KDA80_13025, partial [Planctomycetaceae bacterium]|nr:hypothetical protein [Planctomycetaceae bacterium]